MIEKPNIYHLKRFLKYFSSYILSKDDIKQRKIIIKNGFICGKSCNIINNICNGYRKKTCPFIFKEHKIKTC